MMAGVIPGAKPPTTSRRRCCRSRRFGRYVKILLSSNEFLFVN